MKNAYSLSDAHLGSWATQHQRIQERRLVRFLDSIKEKASAIYLLGDMFDFWNEYRYVVPKGYTHFLGKISELTDMGVKVHYFTGSHDPWIYGYLKREYGVIVHQKPLTTGIGDKVFFLAHGGRLGDPDHQFKLLRKIFHNPICQRLFNAIHPRWGMQLGLTWAKYSRLKRADGKEMPCLGGDEEYLVQFTHEYMKTYADANYFIYGHRYIELDLTLSRKIRMLVLGNWIWQLTYAAFDGGHMFMEQYIEDESKPQIQIIHQ